MPRYTQHPETLGADGQPVAARWDGPVKDQQAQAEAEAEQEPEAEAS